MLKHLAILGCALAGFLVLARDVAWYGPYIYDQADYMYAVSLGWKANAFDAPSMPIREFVKMGLDRGRGSANRVELSSMVRGTNDVLFYRHWHGPVYGYWLAFTDLFTTDARAKRKLNYLFAGATALLLYFGTLWVLGGAAGETAAILSLFLYFWSYAVIKTSELAPHQLFAMLTTAILLLLAKLFTQGGAARQYWYAAVFVSALAFSVLEVAFALILTVAICGWYLRGALKFDWKLALKSAGIFLASVLIVWPAAVLKLSPIKSYLFMAYLALFRQAAWGAQITLAETWRLHIMNSPVLWLLVMAAIVCLLIKPKTRIPAVAPFAIFSVLMFLATARVNTDVARYELPLLPGIVLLSSFTVALVLAQWAPVKRYAAVIAICAATFAASWPAIRTNLSDPVQETDTVLGLIRDFASSPSSGVLLVPQGHVPMIHYYFPAVQLRAYVNGDDADTQLREGGISGVLTDGLPPRLIQIQPRAQ